MVTWIMIANASQAHCYTCNEKGLHTNKFKLELLQSFEHPESRKKDGDLISDRAGHFQSTNFGHASYISESDPKAIQAEIFAKELADELDAARINHHYQQLILVVPAQFLGLINKHLNKNIEPLISHTIQKDYTKLPILDLHHQLQAQLKKE